MFQKRTDLAMEVHELHGENSGIKVKEITKKGVNITEAEVMKGEGERLSGKSAGKYITVDIGNVWQYDKEKFESLAKTLANEISLLLPEGNGSVFVAGLGNEEITPDSLGPRTVKKLLVTRHIETIDSALYKNVGFGSLAAIASGVLGQTGIESAEIIKSVSENIKPKCIILIDSLASRKLSRLATTVQLSNTGISPGSGVSNKRHTLDSEYLKAPVVSIGVPMVVDAATLAYDLLEEYCGGENENFENAISKILNSKETTNFVTPKDNDMIARSTAKLLATAINIAVHNMEISEISEFIE